MHYFVGDFIGQGDTQAKAFIENAGGDVIGAAVLIMGEVLV